MSDPDPGASEPASSSEPRSAVVDRFAAADRRLVMSDFDGTLAEIVPRPKNATIRPDARTALEALSTAPNTEVAVVSGRAKADIEERVGLPGIWYAGNHGLEISVDGETFVHPEARATRSAIEAACGELGRRLRNVDGAFVEGKGLTATIHYRMVEDAGHVDAVREVVQEVTDQYASALEVHDGKQVFELRPAVEWHKGRAVEWIRDTAYDDPTDVFSVYVGDDVSDEAAWRALNDDGVAVRVGDTASASAADLTLDHPEAVARLLARLADVASAT